MLYYPAKNDTWGSYWRNNSIFSYTNIKKVLIEPNKNTVNRLLFI